MLSLNFIRGSKRRTKAFHSNGTLTKPRPEIRRIASEQDQLVRSKVSFEVLDINEKGPSYSVAEEYSLSEHSLLSEDPNRPVTLPLSPPPPTPPSKHSKESPRVEIDIPEENSGLNDWFPPHLLKHASPVEPDSTPELKHTSPSVKKQAPTPIKIPNHALHGPKVQLQRSSLENAHSRPPSASSLDEMSTISGTTLARALIGSNFVFPNESRSSRYRSGMTPLTRQDSATLPRGDDPLINSPYWRDKRISGGEIVKTPDPNNDIPPVPTIPPALRSRTHSNANQDETNPGSSSQDDNLLSPYSAQASTPDPSDVLSPKSTSSYPTTESTYDTSPLPFSPDSGIATPSSAMDDVLDYYQSTKSATQYETRPFSPIMEASTSAEASLIPSPYTTTSNDDAASLSSARSKASSFKAGNIKRLPIGESPSQRQKRLSTSSNTAELRPPPRPTIGRGRSGSAPSPIIVVRDSKDYTRYNITISPLPEVLSPTNSTSEHGQSSHQQTFPETPRAFSPLWTPEPSSGKLIKTALDASAAGPARARSMRRAASSEARTVHRATTINSRMLIPPPGDAAAALEIQSDRSSPALTTSHETPRHITQNTHDKPVTPHSCVEASHHQPSNISPSSASSSAEVSLLSTSPPQLNAPSQPRKPSDSEPLSESDSITFNPSFTFGAPSSYSSVVESDPSTPNRPCRDSLASESSFIRGPSNRRSRMRPPLPLGPRLPTGGSSTYSARERNGSVSSISSGLTHTPRAGSIRRNGSTPTPRFTAPPPKFKGLTMDHAKWTFTSAELQTIVSQAIRKSAEASSIRLLPLETIQDQLPEELSRLEIQREDLKLRYKLLARKRFALISSLSGQTEVEEGENVASANLRLLGELKQVSIQIDQVAEELYVVGEQIAQATAAREVHAYSALAMALRKLNTSFVRQVADAQDLKLELENLRQERDAAWEQAERIANELDSLVEKDPPDSFVQGSSSRRSSRALARRRSTIRVQAAMRSSSIARSKRSSASSAIAHLSMTSCSSASRGTFLVPPVPPIPRDRPQPPMINVDVNPRESVSITDSSVYENSAMAQIQQELYDMLGIADERTGRHTRRHNSCHGSTRDSASFRAQVGSEIRRPSSLPDHSIDDASSVNTTMLNTLALLSPN